MSFHFFLSATNSLHLLTHSTWRSLSTSSFHLFLSLPLLLVPSSYWVKIFLGILSSSILSRWPNQLILYPFIHFTIFSPLLMSSSSRFVRLFHYPFSYIGPYILLIIFFQKLVEIVFLSSSTPMLPLHTDNHPYRVLHRYSKFSWWWAHISPKPCGELELNTLRGSVHLVGFIWKRLYRDARSTDIKIMRPRYSESKALCIAVLCLVLHLLACW